MSAHIMVACEVWTADVLTILVVVSCGSLVMFAYICRCGTN